MHMLLPFLEPKLDTKSHFKLVFNLLVINYINIRRLNIDKNRTEKRIRKRKYLRTSLIERAFFNLWSASTESLSNKFGSCRVV